MEKRPESDEYNANTFSKVAAASYKFLPVGIKFDSLASFNAEMEPTKLGGADFSRYSKRQHLFHRGFRTLG